MNFNLPVKMYKSFKAAAAARHTSMSELLRRLVREFLREENDTASR